MNFFIDFEASQFAEEIISIGCVCEDGDRFHTLVKPENLNKVTPFITDLTGITKEQLATDDVPDIESAIFNFHGWVFTKSADKEDEVPNFICYGNGDKHYLEKAIKHTKDFNTAMYLRNISSNLEDYSKTLVKLFNLDAPFKLINLYNDVKEVEKNQKHNALEDAEMLKEIYDYFSKKENQISYFKRVEGIIQSRITSNLIEMPDAYLRVSEGKMWESDTGTPETAKIKAVSFSKKHKTKGQVKYFDSEEIAIYWVMKFLAKKKSPKSLSDYKTLQIKLAKALRKHINWYDFKWERC